MWSIIKWFKGPSTTGEQYVEVSKNEPLPVQIVDGGGGGGATEVNVSGSGGDADTANGSSDTNAPTQIGMLTNARMMGYDGTNFRRVQVDTNGNMKAVVQNSPTWDGVGNILQGSVAQGEEKLVDLSAEGATAVWIQADPSNTVPLQVSNVTGFEGAWIQPGSSEWFYYPKIYIKHSASDTQNMAYQAVKYG